MDALGQSRGGGGGGAEHFFDGTNASDGLFGEGEGKGDGADQLAVDINGAAGHALHDAGVFEAGGEKTAEDEVLIGARVAEDAEDAQGEFFGGLAREDSAGCGGKAGSELGEGEKAGLSGEARRQEGGEGCPPMHAPSVLRCKSNESSGTDKYVVP